MPTQYDMGPDSEIYRAILEWDYEPFEWVTDPLTNRREKRKTGPIEVRERMIGPYQNISPIKAYVTRNRGRWQSNNLRIKRIERVSAWEEVAD